MLDRRTLIKSAAAFTLIPAAVANALTAENGNALVSQLVKEINEVIASGQSTDQMLSRFEKIFSRYADVPAIARSSLGAAARSATPEQLEAYTRAFRGYMARKYGRRFNEFKGGKIEVTGVQPIKSYIEVISTATLPGDAPFEVRWHVSDKSGSPLFFNIIIEGVNMLAAERAEIGAMLDQAGGDIGDLITRMNSI